MIFEEAIWADNDAGKHLQQLVFDIPKELKSHSTYNRPEFSNCTDAGANQKVSLLKSPDQKSRVSQTVEKKVPSSKRNKAKAADKIHVVSAGEKALKQSKKRLDNKVDLKLENNTSKRSTSSKETNCEMKQNSVKDGCVQPCHSNWRKRAFSRLLQGNASSTVSPPPQKKQKPDSVVNKGGTVDTPKHMKLESKNKSADKTIGFTESRSAALNRSVTSKLKAAQFRFINEQLYTRSSKEARQLFANEKKLFQIYHDGYTQQISRWPNNPLDPIIDFLKKRPSSWVIGDFGCGDARLAHSIKNKVHSFDLVASNDRVTVADIAHVPLPNESLDAAVLCLSLMGTNYIDFLTEANRTLKVKGVLLVAEIESRFKSILKFKNLMKNMGFQLKKEDKNSYFVSFNFMKLRTPNREIKTASDLLKPCVYKKR